jgi:hypothetical protein
MKKVLSLLAVAALLMFNGCNPSTSTTPITDALKSAKKGWVMTSVKSTPAYVLDSGVALDELFADGTLDDNTGFFFSYEKDDAIIFGENGVQTIDPGKLLPEDPTEAYQIATPAAYTVDEAAKLVYFQMPWEYNADYTSYDLPQEKCTVQEYSTKKIVIKYTRNDDENPAKAQNTFTITYEPVK